VTYPPEQIKGSNNNTTQPGEEMGKHTDSKILHQPELEKNKSTGDISKIKKSAEEESPGLLGPSIQNLALGNLEADKENTLVNKKPLKE